MEDRGRHPVERGGMQRQPLGRCDLLRRHALLDGQGLGDHRPHVRGKIREYLPL